MHARLQTWFPFQIQIYMNGREWLAKQLDGKGIGYQRYDNSMVQVDDVKRAQEIAGQFIRVNFAKAFDAISRQINPVMPRIKKIFSRILLGTGSRGICYRCDVQRSTEPGGNLS